MTLSSLVLTLALVLLASGYSAVFYGSLIGLITTLGTRRWLGALVAVAGFALFPLAALYYWRSGEEFAYPTRLLTIGSLAVAGALVIGAIALFGLQ